MKLNQRNAAVPAAEQAASRRRERDARGSAGEDAGVPSDSRGFSLIEVLVATVLLAVTLLALFSLVTMGMRRSYGGRKMTEATVLAQTVLERANVPAPHLNLGAAGDVQTASMTWKKTKNSHADDSVDDPSGGTAETAKWRELLRDSDLPSTDDDPSELQVTITALPLGKTFDEASMVRVAVNVTWTEWGSRERTVRLQTLNLRSADL